MKNELEEYEQYAQSDKGGERGIVSTSPDESSPTEQPTERDQINLSNPILQSFSGGVAQRNEESQANLQQRIDNTRLSQEDITNPYDYLLRANEQQRAAAEAQAKRDRRNAFISDLANVGVGAAAVAAGSRNFTPNESKVGLYNDQLQQIRDKYNGIETTLGQGKITAARQDAQFTAQQRAAAAKAAREQANEDRAYNRQVYNDGVEQANEAEKLRQDNAKFAFDVQVAKDTLRLNSNKLSLEEQKAANDHIETMAKAAASTTPPTRIVAKGKNGKNVSFEITKGNELKIAGAAEDIKNELIKSIGDKDAQNSILQLYQGVQASPNSTYALLSYIAQYAPTIPGMAERIQELLDTPSSQSATPSDGNAWTNWASPQQTQSNTPLVGSYFTPQQ